MQALLSASLLSPVLDLYARGRTDAALEVCAQIANDYPDCAEAFAILAELNQRQGDTTAWLDNARRAYELGGAPFRNALTQALASHALQHAESDDVYALLGDLVQLFELDAGDEAGAIFHFLLDRHRANPDVASAVVNILRRFGRDSWLAQWGDVAPQILLVLPPRQMDVSRVNRLIKSLEQNLGQHRIVVSVRGAQTFSPEAIGGRQMLPWESTRTVCYSHVVTVEDPGDREWSEQRAREHPRVYRFDQSTRGFEARLMPVGREVGPEDYPHVSSHVFNRVTTRLHGHYYFFPYGYLFRYLGYGPINAFGHRLACDPAPLRERPSRHKLILCFGGSSCYSMYCLHDEMFSTRLEVKLNEWSRREGRDLEFTVLNYGQHGNVVLNELLTYLLFAQSLRPDVVISHSGFNDLMYGQLTDPALVAGQHITYQENLEAWAAMLNGSAADLPGERYVEGMRQVQNQPGDVIDAYLARLRQFAAMVTADGARFLWGLQPWLLSKKKLSADERNYMRESMEAFNPFRDGYRNLPFVYEQLEARREEMDIGSFINVHRAFSSMPADTSHFYDIVHLSPEGDEHIAEHYASLLQSQFSGAPA